MSGRKMIDIQLKFVSLSLMSPRFCRYNLFLCFIKIAFTWLKPASAMYEVGNASKKGSAAALSLGYLLVRKVGLLSSSIDIYI